ncbi:MAG: hypothetical protein HDT41_05045 [Lachnospiraceae bacterium]|nr:hypothetical protein [Lachnospiraceae bacterium]
MNNITNEKDAKIAKVLVIIMFIVFEGFLATIYVPEEIAYFTSEKTSAVVCSEGYIDKYPSPFTRGNHYYYNYMVEYEVNGQIYTSRHYRTGNRRLQEGDVVTLHYDGSNPQNVKNVRFPITSIIMIICTIVVIYHFRKDKVSK